MSGHSRHGLPFRVSRLKVFADGVEVDFSGALAPRHISDRYEFLKERLQELDE